MSQVVQCREQLRTSLQSIAGLANRVHTPHSPDQLAAMIKNSTAPANVGVVYQGLSAKPEVGKTPKGLAATAQFGLFLAVSAPAVTVGGTPKFDIDVANLLDSMRDALLGTSAPTGHKWEFVSEGYADAVGGYHLWVQQWRTTIVK